MEAVATRACFEWLGRCTVRSSRNGAIEVGLVAAERNFRLDDWSLIVDDVFFAHYFHFVEFLLLFSQIVHDEFQGIAPRRLLLRDNWNNEKHSSVQGKMLSILFPQVHLVVLADDPILVEDAFRYDSMAFSGRLNKTLEGREFAVHRGFPDLRERVLSAVCPMSGDRMGGSRKKALHVRRDPPRCFCGQDEARLLSLIGQAMEVETVDFSTMSWEEQVSICARVDLLFGVHGNGLTNLLWLPRSAAVMEFFPEGARHYDYQMLSEIAGVKYFGFEGSNVYRDLSRSGPAYGHGSIVNKPVGGIDWANVQTVFEFLAAGHCRSAP